MASENNMRKVRQSEGITVAQLARTSDVSDRTIRKIENRTIVAKVETKARLVNAINKDSGKDYKYPEIFPSG